ncbi:ATP-binding protein [Terasakiella sp.]|uniref:PAS domain-containing hybrid sensor histidine kinase/response regulator n=1 Tax=Terasakiella sp. TaxID=2034861 RepID=UPI003AA82C19
MTLPDQNNRLAALEAENKQLKEEVERVRLSERRFLDALRLSPMAMCHHDRDLRYTWLYNGHMGFVQDDVIGLTDWDILDKDLADRMGTIKRRVLETGRGERVEMPTVAGDENSEYFDLVVEPLKDEATGDIVGLSCSGIDVTQDRRRREAYKASEENLRFIFNASPMPIVVVEQHDDRVLFFNRAAQAVFNLENNQKIFDELDLPADVRQNLIDQQGIEDYKLSFSNPARETLVLTLSCTPIFYDGLSAFLCTFHNLTKEVHYQRQLEEAKEKAELASLAKSQFLAAASHDLRQPLHAIGLLLGVLEQHIPGPEGLQVLERVMTSLETMNELFSGILDISKLDANAVPVRLEPVNVARCFEVLEDEFAPIAARKGLQLVFVKSSLWILSDPLQFDRILRNLIANAVRYTQSGRILVGARRKGERLRICVLDTGIGIEEKDYEIIFQEFRQLGNRERDRRKGLGLGLAICERVAKLLKTKIQLTSVLGKGSMFSFDVETCEVDESERANSSRAGGSVLQGKRILFIEDEIDVQTATKYMLEAWGCVTLLAATEQEALEFCKQVDQRLPFDAIVADYRLRGEETGLDVILSLRRKLGVNTPSIVLSGETAASLIRKLEMQNVPLLTKPVMPADLREALSNLVT